MYERAVSRTMFRWPHVGSIWQAYLSQFVERYKGTKLERARDLYKQALEAVGPGGFELFFVGACCVMVLCLLCSSKDYCTGRLSKG